MLALYNTSTICSNIVTLLLVNLDKSHCEQTLSFKVLDVIALPKDRPSLTITIPERARGQFYINSDDEA